MKKIILPLLYMVFVLAACNSGTDKTKETAAPKTTAADSAGKKEINQSLAEQLYSCSMHPEVTGKKDATCSKCGMKLTVPVKN